MRKYYPGLDPASLTMVQFMGYLRLMNADIKAENEAVEKARQQMQQHGRASKWRSR